MVAPALPAINDSATCTEVASQSLSWLLQPQHHSFHEVKQLLSPFLSHFPGREDTYSMPHYTYMMFFEFLLDAFQESTGLIYHTAVHFFKDPLIDCLAVLFAVPALTIIFIKFIFWLLHHEHFRLLIPQRPLCFRFRSFARRSFGKARLEAGLARDIPSSTAA
jgi:hypothetical protein